MEAYRITQTPFADLAGKGGLYANGRWHSRGRPIVYMSGSRALAVLEALVHTDPEELADDSVLLTVSIPDPLVVQEIGLTELPPNWSRPRHPECVALGDRWLQSAAAAILQVPSALVSEELNVLLNPLHPDAAQVRISAQRSFRFDARLLDPALR
jgi:RES domain-containing protein